MERNKKYQLTIEPYLVIIALGGALSIVTYFLPGATGYILGTIVGLVVALMVSMRKIEEKA